MMAPSRTGSSLRPAIRSRISGFQSGMLQLRDAIDGCDEGLPDAALRGENFLPIASQFVVAAAALARLLNPAAFDPASVLESVEQGIEGSRIELEGAVGARLDEFADFVAVSR